MSLALINCYALMLNNGPSEVSAQRTLGSGSECVYLYYFENDRELARAERRDQWECKIGYTRRRLEKRLLEQGLSTTLARYPVVALEILIDNAQVLETRIHRALRDQRISHGAGNEWYMTNPDEVEAIYLRLLPSMEKLAAVLDTFFVTDEAFEVDSPETMGNALRAIRAGLATTQGETGKLAGIRQASISRIENGSDGTRLDTLLRLLRSYGYHMLLVRND